MGLLTKNMVYRRLGHGGMSMNKQVQSIPAEIARSEPAPTLAERLRIARGRQSHDHRDPDNQKQSRIDTGLASDDDSG